MSEGRALGRYLAGAGVARTGDEMSGPALLVLGLAVTGSAANASALLAGLTAAAAIGGPVLGALLDRSAYPGRLLATALACYGAGLAAILGLLGHAPIAVVVALAALTGLLAPSLSGGWTSRLPSVLGHTPLARATALDALTFDAAALLGPALAGLLAGALGAPWALATAIGLVVLAAPAAWALPPARAPERRSLRHDLAAGFTAIVKRRKLLRATVTSTVSFVGVGMFVVCCPLLGETHLGDAANGAFLLAVVAVTGLLANAVLARFPLPPDGLLLASVSAMAAGTLLAAAGFPWPAAAIVGLGEGPQLTALFAIRHREAPEHLRAQIFTTGASLKISGFALGSAIAGPLAAHSLTACLIVAGGMHVLAAGGYPPLGGIVRTPSPARGA